MAFLTLEDLYGRMEVVVFPRTYDRSRTLLKSNKPLLIRGRINYNEEMNISIIADQILPIDQVRNGGRSSSLVNNTGADASKRVRSLVLAFNDFSQKSLLEQIKPILRRFPGEIPVVLYFVHEQKKFKADKRLDRKSHV